MVEGRLDPGLGARPFWRSDVGVAASRPLAGGILLRGVGYQSNDAAVLTNVSPDHLDLQGIHTLPELARSR